VRLFLAARGLNTPIVVAALPSIFFPAVAGRLGGAARGSLPLPFECCRTLIAEHTEVETGRRNDRPELAKALAAYRRHKAKLVIAKLDRLSRNLAFIAAMMDSGVEFVACDNPHATRLALHILAAVAKHERSTIAERTRAALLP
jgi:hypothetical protein